MKIEDRIERLEKLIVWILRDMLEEQNFTDGKYNELMRHYWDLDEQYEKKEK